MECTNTNNLCTTTPTPLLETTLGELYENFYKQHISRLSPSGRNDYIFAWKRLKHLSNRPFRELTLDDYQQCMDQCSHLSKSTQMKLKNLISQLHKRAILIGLTQVNLALYLELSGYESTGCDPFEPEEIELLEQCAQNPSSLWQETAMIVLTLIFTGWRPEELFAIKKTSVNLSERYFTSGSKTAAGKNRIVPIAECIYQYVLYFYYSNSKSEYLIPSPSGHRMDLKNWRVRKFYPCLQELGINQPDAPHRIKPYSARATFATMAYRAGVDRASLEKMIGHTDYYFTAQRYIRHNIKDFHREMDKIVSHYYTESEGTK